MFVSPFKKKKKTHEQKQFLKIQQLDNPPIFYMFSQIITETHSKWLPSKSTEDRWDEFVALSKVRFKPKKHHSFPEVFAALKEREYISLTADNDEVWDQKSRNNGPTATEEYDWWSIIIDQP